MLFYRQMILIAGLVEALALTSAKQDKYQNGLKWIECQFLAERVLPSRSSVLANMSV
jgi:hypothetical protein